MTRNERFTELEEMILAGWGDTMGSLIPPDWRTRRPYPISTPVQKPVETEDQITCRILWERDTAKRADRAREWQARKRMVRAQRILFQEEAIRNRQAQQSQRRKDYLREVGRVEA